MPEISVVIPSYNHAAFLREAVESVLNQTFSDLELIVIDDGSKDNSLQVLTEIDDPRLHVFSQENQGAHAAINTGLRRAQAPYLAILNSDDAYHPARLEQAVRLLQSDPQIGLVASHIEIVDAEGKTLGVKHAYQDCEPWLLPHLERSFRAGQDTRAALLTENYLATTSNYVFRRSAFEAAGEFLPLRYAHDWDFALRLLRHASLGLIPEPLLRYRVHATNTIRENQAAMILEICWVLAVHLPQMAFVEAQPLAQRVDQLLHSIYTFDLDRVLSVLLIQGVARQPEAALRLLDPSDPTRAQYLAYIERELAGRAALPAPSPAPGVMSKVKQRMKGLLR